MLKLIGLLSQLELLAVFSCLTIAPLGVWSGIYCTACGRAIAITFASAAPPLVTHTIMSFRMSTFWCVYLRMGPRMSWKHLIWNIFRLLVSCHWPSLYTVQTDRHYLCSENLHFGGLAEVSDFPPAHWVRFTSLLEPHCYFFLYPNT